MVVDFDRVARALEKLADAKNEYARACELLAAGLVGHLASLPADRIGRATAQMWIALADAAAGSGDAQGRQAWQILALRNGTSLPGEDDEMELLLRLGRVPSDEDVTVLEGLGFKPARAGAVGYRGRCSLAAVAPFAERYDGYVQDASSGSHQPRARQPRHDDVPGDTDSTTLTSVSDLAAEPGAVATFVPRAPLSPRGGGGQFGDEAATRTLSEYRLQEQKQSHDDRQAQARVQNPHHQSDHDSDGDIDQGSDNGDAQ